MQTCLICKSKFPSARALSNHIRSAHNLSPKEYYDKYLIKGNENVCPICGRENKFKSLSEGYSRVCSKKCLTEYNKTIGLERAKRTCLEKYGVDNPMKDPNIKELVHEKLKEKDQVAIQRKREEIFLKKYGVKNPMQVGVLVEKQKTSLRKNLGVDNPMKSEEIVKKVHSSRDSKACFSKARNTWIEKYGVDNPMKLDFFKDKRRRTNSLKYGVEIPTKLESIKDKIRNTMEEKYGGWYVQLPEVKQRAIEGSKKRAKKIWLERIKRIQDFTVLGVDLEHYRVLAKCLKCGWIGWTWFDKNWMEFKKDYNLRCWNCFPKNVSSLEEELATFLERDLNISFQRNVRGLLGPMEIDFYIPERKIGIEIHGLYWHSEDRGGKDKFYHLKKFELASKRGIHLVQIFESEWLGKKEIVKDILIRMLRPDKIQSIGAREIVIQEISQKVADIFLEEDHLQGLVRGPIRLGAFYKGSLVSVMLVGQSRFKKDSFEILRFCQKRGLRIVGIIPKFLKILRDYIPGGKLRTYVDLRYFRGSDFISAGFEVVGRSRPGYFYWKHPDRFNLYNRMTFQKRKLPELLEGFDQELSEWENMRRNGWDRIWDCGNLILEIDL